MQLKKDEGKRLISIQYLLSQLDIRTYSILLTRIRANNYFLYDIPEDKIKYLSIFYTYDLPQDESKYLFSNDLPEDKSKYLFSIRLTRG